MLERFIYFKEEINLLLEKANNLLNSKKNNINIDSFIITNNKWNYLILIRNILKIFRKPIIKLQASNYTIIYYIIPYITKLLSEIENYTLKNLEETNPYLSIALLEAYNKLLDYYSIKDKTYINKLKDLYLTTLLNPCFKLEIFNTLGFNNIIINKIKDYFIEIYNKYKLEYYSNTNININIILQSSINTNITNTNNENSNSDNEFYINKDNNNNNKEEIEIYLKENRISKEINIIDYYKANKNRFPILFNIVKDYLAIMATSAPSEFIFSKTSDIITKKRNRLLPNTIKQIITLKSWNILENEEETINDNNLDFNQPNININNKGKQKEIINLSDLDLIETNSNYSENNDLYSNSD